MPKWIGKVFLILECEVYGFNHFIKIKFEEIVEWGVKGKMAIDHCSNVKYSSVVDSSKYWRAKLTVTRTPFWWLKISWSTEIEFEGVALFEILDT